MMAREVLAFDIGGTHIRAALVKKNKIIKFLTTETPKDKEKFLNQIQSFTNELLSRRVKKIGISIAGVVKNGVVVRSPNLPITNFNLKQYMTIKYKRKVSVKNDAECFSIAELYLGCKSKNFVLITLGTGIGSGIVIHGIPYNGGTGLGGEVGHMYVRGKDFESLWKKTKNRIKSDLKKHFLIRDLVKMKSNKAKSILKESADYLGEGLASINAILEPEVFIFAGGPSESGKPFIKMINQSFVKYNFIPRNPSIKWSRLVEPGILGASLIVDL